MILIFLRVFSSIKPRTTAQIIVKITGAFTRNILQLVVALLSKNFRVVVLSDLRRQLNKTVDLFSHDFHGAVLAIENGGALLDLAAAYSRQLRVSI